MRHAPIGDTRHFVDLRKRLTALRKDSVASAVAAACVPLVQRLEEARGRVPVCARWHGDFAPWNRARDRSGQLWIWDWESSEPDAVAGLDALHWAFSVRRPPSGRTTDIDLAGCLEAATPWLRAAGVRSEHHGHVAAVYALTVVDRAADLARRSGSWNGLWVDVDQLKTLLSQAIAGLSPS